MATYYALPTLTTWLPYGSTGHVGWSLTSGGPDAGTGIHTLADSYVFDVNSGPGRSINIDAGGMYTSGGLTISSAEAFNFTGGFIGLWGPVTLTPATSFNNTEISLNKSTLNPNGAYISRITMYAANQNLCYIDSDVRLGSLLFSAAASGDENYLYFRNGANVTIPLVATISSTTYNQLFMGSGTWTFTGSGTVLSNGGVTAETCTMKFTNSSATAATVTGATYYPANTLWIATTGTGGFYLPSGTWPMGTLKVTGPAKVQLRASMSTPANEIDISGEGATAVLVSDSPGTYATLTKNGGGEVVLRYCDIKDISFAGTGATCKAIQSKDSGHNLGITFIKALASFLPFF